MPAPRRRAGVALPVLPAPPPPLRADAARNRAKLLAAAARLFAEREPEAVSVDEVVSAAGVGKGTLFRIFGDKSGLATALLDEEESALQRAILSGPPPLGPGGDPVDRLSAFVNAYVRFVGRNAGLVTMSQTARPGARFTTGSHRFWRAHLRHLLALSGAAAPEVAADVLLAAMTGEQIDQWLRSDGRRPGAVARELVRLAQSWCDGEPGARGVAPRPLRS